MAASQKVIDSSNRLRYIRALERFHKSILSYLNNTPELSTKGFSKKIDNALKLLNRIDEIDLYKGELKDLQTLVKKIVSLKESEKSIEDIKDEILHETNQLDKNKNARRYKKDKHANSKYDDGN
ncbi:MAG: DNA repair ATPase RecN [Sulfurimonas sp.]|jgi:DNA repair ATPase RecN|uniref:hypothetical protein n=1 Tax=Sulfurimonas sp. TaxID=2022749 RepID=UPI0039E43D43